MPLPGVFFLILFLILLIYAGWVGWRIYGARKRGERLQGWRSYVPFMKSSSSSGTNYPTPRSAGPLEWIKDKIDGLRNKRSQTGGYEDSRAGAEGSYQNLNSGGRGRDRGLEDDAWNSHVGGRDEDPYGPGPGGYHEEAELGLAPTPGYGPSSSYGGGTDYMNHNTGYGGGASSSRSRGSDVDPFADSHAASSMRSVSPRPELGGLDTRGHKKGDSEDGGNTSPISTRKSIFREDVS